MAVTASQVFDFLDRHSTALIERHEVSSAAFSILRHSLRAIVLNLHESGDGDVEARDASDRMRMLLSEWLTVPVRFDGAVIDAVQTLGDPDAVEARWGHDVRISYDAARTTAQELARSENPVRAKLRTVLDELRVQARSFRIYCHRRAAIYFESILDQSTDVPLREEVFLHSVKDYRETEPFDVLIKVGPLRARGWGAIPDAIVTAPRFSTLVQIVWSGCGNESGFGYDPVVSTAGPGAVTDQRACGSGVSWSSRIIRSGSDEGATPGDITDVDELQIFREYSRARERRRATLVQIDGEHGILYPPHSQVLSFDPNPGAQEPIGHRTPGETLVEGVFVVRPLLGDVDLGGLQAEHGHYSQVWKARLAEERQRDSVGLSIRLSDAGLNLVHLYAAIDHWCKPPTTVIHAPQQMKHFEILIRVLGVGFDSTVVARQQRAPWWKYAWNEIRRTRGEAIHAGVVEQQIVEEQLLSILKSLLPDVRREAGNSEDFPLLIPSDQELKGAVLFNKVRSVEEGFLAPDTELKLVCELNTIEQWRV